MPANFELHTRCVDVPSQVPEYIHVDRLEDMMSRGREISADSFFRHVPLGPISEFLGYAHRRGERGVRLKTDPYVRFHISKWRGRRCYYLVWSAIEHVFLAPADAQELARVPL